MAIGIIQDFPGATLAQYDEVVKRMGFQPGGPGAPGGLFHWVTKTPNGVRVIDVWQSREQYEKFSGDKIKPITAQVGVPAPDKVEFFEVHNYLTKG